MLPQLSPEEFLGVCHMMNILLLDEQSKPKEANFLINEVINKFSSYSRVRKKNLLKIVAAAAKGDNHADTNNK